MYPYCYKVTIWINYFNTNNAQLQKFELCIMYTFTKEDKDFYAILQFVKNKIQFYPKRNTNDFSKSNIEVFKMVYGEGKIIITTSLSTQSKLVEESQ